MMIDLRTVARPGLYVVEFPMHTKIGQSAQPLFRLGEHGANGGVRAWLSSHVVDVDAAEAVALRMAAERVGLIYRKKMREEFPGLPFLEAVEMVQGVVDMFTASTRPLSGAVS